MASLIGFALLILGLAAVVALPGWRKLRSWRSEQLLVEATDALAARRHSEARDAARAALHLNPTSLGALRTLAGSMVDVSKVQALVLQERVLRSSEDDPEEEDLRDYIALCIDLDFRAASPWALDKLLERNSDDARNWVLGGEYLLASGQIAAAARSADKALQLDPNNVPARLLGCKSALWAEDPNIRTAAVRGLLDLGRRDDMFGLEAVASIAVGPESISPEYARAAADRLRVHPASNVDARLLAAMLDYRAAENESARDAVVVSTVEAFKSNYLVPLAGWLHLAGRHDKIVELLPGDKAVQSPELFGALVSALQLEGEHDAVVRLFDVYDGRVPMSVFHRHLLLMHSHAALGESEIAVSHWNTVLRKARIDNPEVSLVLLAQWSEQNGHTAQAIEAYELLVEQHRDLVSNWYDALVRLYRVTGNTGRLLELTNNLAGAYPRNPVYRHNAAYLSILTGAGSPQAIDTLEAVIEEYPQVTAARCAIALGHHQLGNTEASKSALQLLDRGSLSALDRIIYDTVSGAPTGASRGAPMAGLTLLPEERQLFGLDSAEADASASED